MTVDDRIRAAKPDVPAAPVTTDTEAAAVWERLTPARKAMLLRCSHGGGALTETIRSLAYADGLLNLDPGNVCGWSWSHTDLGRRVAAHGRKVAP